MPTVCCLGGEIEGDGPLPFGVIPKEKLSVASMAKILRDRSGEKPFSTQVTIEGAVFQLRQEMPADIGCVYWRISCEPSTGVLVPWYCGITRTPSGYFPADPLEDRLTPQYQFAPSPGTFEPDDKHIFWKLKRVQDAVYADYDARIDDVRARWEKTEERLFEEQPAVEKEALRLWETDPDAARALLTRHGREVSDRVQAEAERIVEEMAKASTP